MTIGKDGRERVLRYEDVTSIRLEPTENDFACVLLRRSGRAWRLPPEVAPFDIARDALEITLIRELVRRLDDRINGGEAVAPRTPGPGSSGWLPRTRRRCSWAC